MSTLIFDIETVGEEFDSLDETTQGVLTRWIKKESFNEADYESALQDLKDGLGFSPLTGQVVAIGVLDYERNQGVVYFSTGASHEQAPSASVEEFKEGEFTFKPMTEKEMLEHFWKGALKYTTFVTFNGRGFDAPFLMVRSAVHKIQVTRNLMSNRYLSSQYDSVQHIDLQDQLTFYGAVRRKGSLHLWSRAFGIKSPKEDGVSGDDVGRMFKEGKFADIARYNVGDLRATKELYEYWRDYLRI